MLNRMLAPQATHRPQSTDEVLQAFEALLVTPGPRIPATASTTVDTTMRIDVDASEEHDWKPEVLHAIEVTLEMYVGPLAHILVRKLSGSTRHINQLCEQLSRFIPSVTKRQEFLSTSRHVITTGGVSQSSVAVSTAVPPPSDPVSTAVPAPTSARLTTPPPTMSPSISTGSLPFEAETLRRLERALAEQLGPLAKVLVKKAAREGGSLEDLEQRLAAELQDDAQRRAFLTAVRGH